MKKIFTLIAAAFVTLSVNAQEKTKIYSVSQGNFNTTDGWQYVQVKEGDKAYANFEILSSPNNFDIYESDRNACAGHPEKTPTFDKTKKLADAWWWQLNGGEGTDKSLAEIQSEFTSYLIGRGNPAMTHADKWEYSTTGDNANTWSYKVDETFWEPGCGSLPAQGEYLKVTPIVDGKIKVGLYVNKNFPQFFVIDGSTGADGYTVLPQSAFTVIGYLRTNTWDGYKDGEGVPYPRPYTLTITEGYTLQPEGVNQQFLGTVEFAVKKGVSYYLLNPKSQLGFYGFAYTYDKAAADAEQGLEPPTDPTGIEAITTKGTKFNANAPMYNLSGQKVDKSYKGIVIQNGRKFMNK